MFTDSGSSPLVVIEFNLSFIRAISHPSMFPYTVVFRIALDENLGHFTNYFDHFTQYILVILLENCFVIK